VMLIIQSSLSKNVRGRLLTGGSKEDEIRLRRTLSLRQSLPRIYPGTVIPPLTMLLALMAAPLTTPHLYFRYLNYQDVFLTIRIYKKTSNRPHQPARYRPQPTIEKLPSLSPR